MHLIKVGKRKRSEEKGEKKKGQITKVPARWFGKAQNVRIKFGPSGLSY